MVKLILVNQRVCGEGITRVSGARGEVVYYKATGEDIGRRSPKLPGWSFYEKMTSDGDPLKYPGGTSIAPTTTTAQRMTCSSLTRSTDAMRPRGSSSSNCDLYDPEV